MFRCTPHPDKKIESMASILILGGVLPLTIALMSQKLLGLHPCHFCLLQRYPYLVVIAMGALSLLVKRGDMAWRICIALGIYALLMTAGLGLIHTGIEEQWLAYTGGCVAQTPADGSLEALRQSIAHAPLVACDQKAAVILGLSMATWNVLWALFVLALTAGQYHHDRVRYDAIVL